MNSIKKIVQCQIKFKVPYKHLQWESRKRNYQFTTISEVLGEWEDHFLYVIYWIVGGIDAYPSFKVHLTNSNT